MPLIIITGLPCSGKTHRAQQILTDFQQRIISDPNLAKRTVQIIHAHHESLDTPYDTSNPNTRSDLREHIYNSATAEKTARAEEFSAIKRAISKDNIVIADSLNYIKGYRYQSWCEAKAAGTRCCVVHVAAQEDECREWNRERLRAWGREGDIELEKGSVEDRKKDIGAKIGRDVRGNLVPESHTAIYGDRVVGHVSRSRSSSIDGGVSDDEAYSARKAEDTMTLKSLYIRDDGEEIPSDPRTNTTHTDSSEPTPPLSTVASSTPPPPTSAPPYLPSTLSSLAMRYEPPSPFSRWDTPLFTIPTSDTHPPYSAIWSALFPPPPTKPTSRNKTPNQQSSTMTPSVEAVKPHAATVLPTATNANALQIIESTTLDVVKALLASARDQNLASGEGGEVFFTLPLSTSNISHKSSSVNASSTNMNGEGQSDEEVQISLPLPPGLVLNQPMLQRLRRKYTQIQRGGIAHGQGYVNGRRKVIEGFVRFLEGEFEG